jgi:NTP pyrophosphatase (non-canonical NTP hydrolase)
MRSSNDAIKALLEFRDARDWKQFHNPKDLAVALSIEASELLEHFLWKGADEADPAGIREELADVLAYALLLAHHYGLDPEEIVLDKVRLNAERYPADKARGRATKHTEL